MICLYSSPFLEIPVLVFKAVITGVFVGPVRYFESSGDRLVLLQSHAYSQAPLLENLGLQKDWLDILAQSVAAKQLLLR